MTLASSCNLLLSAALPWMPPPASAHASGVDSVFEFVFWICAFFLAIILGLTLRFVWLYRARSFRAAEPSPDHNLRLEVIWTGIPLLLVFAIFGASTSAYLEIVDPEQAGREVQATAKRWAWWFDHPEGTGSAELHVVVGRPVTLVMSAEDVLHSLFIPAMRVKQDVVPGRYSRIHFTPVLAGTFPIYCAEYCGMNHSLMLSAVVVHKDEASYMEWIKAAGYDESMPLVDIGKAVYTRRGCVACHTLDGTPRVAPSFKGIWGRSEALADGSTVTVDEAYVRESIINPKAKITAGFQPLMPPTELEEREIRGIIELLKSVKE